MKLEKSWDGHPAGTEIATEPTEDNPWVDPKRLDWLREHGYLAEEWLAGVEKLTDKALEALRQAGIATPEAVLKAGSKGLVKLPHIGPATAAVLIAAAESEEDR